MKHRLSETFGDNQVSINQREKLIRGVFNRIASRYDLMNDLMSMGIHRLWKRRFCHDVKQVYCDNLVDIAGGTGDVAAGMLGNNRKIMIIDPSLAMMQVAKQRLGKQCDYLAAPAEQLPLADNSVDVVTISFGIRNTTDILTALDEIKRVLKPGGHFYCLEFSTPQFWLRPFYNAWSRLLIPRLGALVARDPDAYQYLIESIRKFPSQQEMAALIRSRGFEEVSWSDLSFGIACIHRAIKIEPAD